MTPPPEALPTDDRERRRWHAFWGEIPDWLKGAIIGVAGLMVGGGSGIAAKSDPALAAKVQALEIKQEASQKQLDRMEIKIDRLLERRGQ